MEFAMNKIFKVKRNSAGQSVVCSEIATSRSKGRVIASALALAVATAATSAHAVEISQVNGLQDALNEKADRVAFETFQNDTAANFADTLARIDNKADNAAVELAKAIADAAIAQNNEQNGKIAENAAAIAAKANAADVDAALATKANQSTVDALRQVDTYLASIAGTNQGNIAKLQTAVAEKADKTEINTVSTQVGEVETKVNALDTKVDTFDSRINALQTNYQNIDSRFNKLDEDLSAGIAGAVALAMMPAPTAGGKYITGGTGFYNGESAVALGFTGTTETGKFTYKLGGALTSSGSGTFGAGAGYRWR